MLKKKKWGKWSLLTAIIKPCQAFKLNNINYNLYFICRLRNQYINIKNAKLVIYNVSFVNALVKEMLNMFVFTKNNIRDISL